MSETQTTVERMADLAHEIWARWMRYMFTKCIFQKDGGILIPAEAAQRWVRQMETRYPDLSEGEKKSDRDIAAEYLGCAKIDALMAERDEAQHDRQALALRVNDFERELAEARAEVNELRGLYREKCIALEQAQEEKEIDG